MGRRLPPREIDALVQSRAQDPASLARLLEQLAPLIKDPRHQKIEQVVARRLKSLSVAVESPFDPHNAAAVIRSAEAFGVHEVHVLNQSERMLRKKRLTTGTHHWVNLRTYRGGPRIEGTDFGDPGPALDGFFERMRAQGMKVAGACVDGACELEALPVDAPMCLLLGNEHSGLSADAQSRCDLRFVVPMNGFAESLNLSVCAAVSMYVTARRRRALLGQPGDLNALERDMARAKGMLNSVDARTVRGLLAREAAQ